MLTAVLGVVASLGPWGSAVAAYLGYQSQKDKERNDPAHQAAAQGQADQDDQDELETNLEKSRKTGDLTQVRKDSAS